MEMEWIYLWIAVLYFTILFLVSYIKGKGASSNNTFFKADSQSKWYWVAIGMVGASLSGVTFISIPGTFQTNGMEYMQVVLGYFIGYFIVAFVLLPLFYKGGYTSIYEYLADKFDKNTQKFGAVLFLISRIIGASFRIFLVVMVINDFIFEKLMADTWFVKAQVFGVSPSFIITVMICIALIWLYTRKGGLKTVVFTDVLQTFFMIGSLVITVLYILQYLEVDFWTFYEGKIHLGRDLIGNPSFLAKNNGLKGVLGGIAITVCMTGLDQDMMQKNLSCRNIKESQWNMMSMSVVLVLVNLAFLIMGALLTDVPLADGLRGDHLYPSVAFSGVLPMMVGIVFLIGLLAAAYSSADSALTSLTTSFCVDIMENKEDVKLRGQVHLLMSVVLIVVVLLFKILATGSVINALLTISGYTYGPLLGLFLFGIFIKNRKLKYIPVLIALLLGTPLILFLKWFLESYLAYESAYELLWINGLLHLLLLYILSFIFKDKGIIAEIILDKEN